MTSKSKQEFEQLIAYVGQLITIHGKLQHGQGRRHEQDAIHRAGVVMTVAAWQTYVEKIIMEALTALEANAGAAAIAAAPPPAPVPAWAKHAFALRRAEIGTSIKKFNTPNAVNVRDLLVGSLEFNTWDRWNWHQGPRQWNSKEMRARLNGWVLVRHSVAHGFPLPDSLPWIIGPNGRPRLTLSLLHECKRFFEHVTAQTDAAFSGHLVSHHGIPKPW